jgi:hypothetical protein
MFAQLIEMLDVSLTAYQVCVCARRMWPKYKSFDVGVCLQAAAQQYRINACHHVARREMWFHSYATRTSARCVVTYNHSSQPTALFVLRAALVEINHYVSFDVPSTLRRRLSTMLFDRFLLPIVRRDEKLAPVR